MKYLILIIISILLTGTPLADVHVKNYYRNDGAYVQPYYRNDPNSIILDNCSTKLTLEKKGWIQSEKSTSLDQAAKLSYINTSAEGKNKSLPVLIRRKEQIIHGELMLQNGR